MIYYIADLHLGHENIISLCLRPFDSIKAMNEAIINNWNSVVKPEDTVYIIGDFSFRSPYSMKPVLLRLNGEKHLIIGNHDDGWMHNLKVDQYFKSVSSLLEIDDQATKVVLCHYPLLTWNRKKYGSVHVHGHLHNRIDLPTLNALKEIDAYNAGVDLNDFKPVTLAQLRINKTRFYQHLNQAEE